MVSLSPAPLALKVLAPLPSLNSKVPTLSTEVRCDPRGKRKTPFPLNEFNVDKTSSLYLGLEFCCVSRALTIRPSLETEYAAIAVNGLLPRNSALAKCENLANSAAATPWCH